MRVPKESRARGWWWVALAAAAAAGVFGVVAVRALTGAGLNPDDVWKQAQQDFMARRYDRTAASLGVLARLRRPTPYDWMLRAQMAMLRNARDEAVADLDRIPDGHELAAQARLLAGQVELRRNRARVGEAYLRKALALNPGLVQAHRELIYTYGMLMRRPELNAEFRALARLTPLTYDNVFHWCLTRNTVWEPRETYSILRSYVEADPDDRWSRLGLAESLRHLGRRAEAESVLKVLPETDPEARVIRVQLALDRGDDETARQILAGGPADHPELARLRGRLALAERDGPAAVAHFRAAYRADPDHRDTIFGLGQAYAMAGDAEAAAPFLAAARDHDALGILMVRAASDGGRRDPGLLRALGAACEKIHRLPEARAWYSLARDVDPLDSEAQKALFRLKSAGAPPTGQPAAP